MAARIDDTILGQGQNEGTDRAILPLPSLARVENARMRKLGRWGKRWGFHELPAPIIAPTPGHARCVGPGFAIVDEQANFWDDATGAWVDPAHVANADPIRKAGAVSAFVPDRAFFPLPARWIEAQFYNETATEYFLGYLWTVKTIRSPGSAAFFFRIAAIDRDQTLVFMADVRPTAVGPNGAQTPRLVVIGSVLTLTYFVFSQGVFGRVLSTLSGGFGPEIAIANDPDIRCFDVAPYTATEALIAIGGNTGSLVGKLSPALALTATSSIASAATEISVAGSPAAPASPSPIYVGYALGAGNASVRAFQPDLSSVIGTYAAGAPHRPLIAILPNGDARVVHSTRAYQSTHGIYLGSFSVVTIAAATAAALGPPTVQIGATPLSMPFAVGQRVYLWCHINMASAQTTFTAGVGSLVLLRIDLSFAPGASPSSFPIEMSAQDYQSAPGAYTTWIANQQALPRVSRLGVDGPFAALLPILWRPPVTSNDLQIDFRVIQARHFTEPARDRSLTSFRADSTSFVPMGVLTRMDQRGAVEVGFVHKPAMGNPVPGGLSGVPPSKTYYYTAVYVDRNALGRAEISAPADPVKVTLTASQGSALVSVTPLQLSASQNTLVEIYRTLGDAQTFYLLTTLSASTPADEITFNDTITDTDLATQKTLYIQVGQQQPNGFPPASRFGCSGGGRVFIAGCLQRDVAVASKLILGDQSPTFCEHDAFKIIVPAPITGIAWMDALVVFTGEGIYTITGDGPTDDGVGDFGTPARLPFPIGCIDPRSVITTEEGTFFQSARGLYLLPRGFGSPIAAGDAVTSTLAEFPVITGAVAMIKSGEQTIRWLCTKDDTSSGQTIVYDLAHKAWSVDRSSASPDLCAGNWLDNEVITAPTSGFHLRLTDESFVDGDPFDKISMLLRTGDIRPFGLQSRGPVQRVSVLTELRAPCTLQIRRMTDRANITQVASRVFSGIAPDDVVGQLSYTQADFGASDGRSLAAVAIEVSENSDGEGLAFIGLSLERGSADGLRLEKPADRIV